MFDTDHTKIDLQTNVVEDRDPMVQRMSGVTNHKLMAFDVPFISQIKGNLYQGGCKKGLILPSFIKHVINLAPWQEYKSHGNGEPVSNQKFYMYDSLDQSTEHVDGIADWVAFCMKDGPTLVHCQAGLNRSSLVAGRALIKVGMTADDAIALLRQARSDAVLCNQTFEDYLRGLEDGK